MSLLLVVGAYAAALVTIGTVVTWLVLPRIREWIRREVSKPVGDLLQQVTSNGGDSDSLGDQFFRFDERLGRVEGRVYGISDNARKVERSVAQINGMFAEHLAWHDKRETDPGGTP